MIYYVRYSHIKVYTGIGVHPKCTPFTTNIRSRTQVEVGVIIYYYSTISSSVVRTLICVYYYKTRVRVYSRTLSRIISFCTKGFSLTLTCLLDVDAEMS